jgi:opacity protein-like surface antigen
MDQTLTSLRLVLLHIHRAATQLFVAALAILTLPSLAGAQRSRNSAPRMEAGGGFEFAQPVGDFRQNVNHGFGGAGHFMVGIDPESIVSVRADAGFINYGNDTHYVPFSSSVRRIIVQEKTSNNIFTASVGPQLTFPVGRVRPYVNAGVGLAYFYTQTSLNTDDDSYEIARSTNYSDNSLLYTAGVGFNIPLSVAASYIGLDIGARYQSIDNARYLTEGDIVDDPNSQYGVIITPHESAANFVTYHLGVSVRF